MSRPKKIREAASSREDMLQVDSFSLDEYLGLDRAVPEAATGAG